MVVDAEGNEWMLPVDRMVDTGDYALDLEDAVGAFAAPVREHRFDVGTGMQLAFTLDGGVNDTVVEGMRLQQRLGRHELEFGYQADPRASLGLIGERGLELGDLPMLDAVASPFVGIADEEAMSLGYGLRVSESVTTRIASFYGRDHEDSETDAFGTIGELGYALRPGTRLSVQLGMLLERDTFLGSEVSGAFGSNEATPTYFGGLHIAQDLGDRLTMVGALHQGLSTPTADDGALLSDFDTIRTEAYSVGLLGRDILDLSDRVGFFISQPIRVSDGSAGLDVATARTVDGVVRRATVREGLSPSGREIAFQAFYSKPLSERTDMGFAFAWRDDPGHVDDADDELVLMLRGRTSW